MHGFSGQLQRHVYVRSVTVTIVSASLSIRIAEQSTYVIAHVFHPCLSAHVNCGKMADWIQMPFGVVSGVRHGMGVLDFGGDRRRGRGSLGVNLRRPIITSGDFVASLCGSAYSDRAVVWRGEWGEPRHSCIRWKFTCLKGKGLFLAWFPAVFRILVLLF